MTGLFAPLGWLPVGGGWTLRPVESPRPPRRPIQLEDASLAASGTHSVAAIAPTDSREVS
jgi:hypothetical protein